MALSLRDDVDDFDRLVEEGKRQFREEQEREERRQQRRGGGDAGDGFDRRRRTWRDDEATTTSPNNNNDNNIHNNNNIHGNINNDINDPNEMPFSPSISHSTTTQNSARLRELQIAFEFERVQSSLPTPSDVSAELEDRFGVSTKYFLGATEMAYALAVSRVDDAIEKRRAAQQQGNNDGCVVGESGEVPIGRNRNDNGSDAGFECIDIDDDDDGALPSPEELVAMEYDNLYTQWDSKSLSSELENQYGIAAKHFMGKKEMAYALAVERVDRAMKEGAGLIYDDDYYGAKEAEGVEEEDAEGDLGEDVAMTEEDMMRMMEREMMMEEEEEERREEKARDAGGVQSRGSREETRFDGRRSREPNTDSFGGRRQRSSSRGDTVESFGRSPAESVRDTPPSKKTFQKREPNPFQKKEPSYRSTPLADMIKDDKKRGRASGRDRRRTPERTPLSSAQHLYNGRQRDPAETAGSVIGDTMLEKDNPSLSDILKGSERRKGNRGPNVDMPPFANASGPKTRSSNLKNPKKVFATSSSRFDDEFQGRSGSGGRSNAGAGGGRGYSSSWNATGGSNVASSSSRNINNKRARSSNAAAARTNVGNGAGDRGYSASWSATGGSNASSSSRYANINNNNGRVRPGNASRSNAVSAGGSATTWDEHGPKVEFSSWDEGPPHSASSAASSSSSSSSSGRGGTGRSTTASSSSSSSTSSQRPFEPTPFTSPGARDSASSSSAAEPRRVPPKTPFSSPVTGNSAEYARPLNSQGPFTPFTPPGRRSTNGTPPPKTRRANSGPNNTSNSNSRDKTRGFNIKDTPDDTQPFVGSQAYVADDDFGFQGARTYSPPLRVEPPPRDPEYGPAPERPFEPAPFADARPHEARTGGGRGRGSSSGGGENRRRSARQSARPPPRSGDNGGAAGGASDPRRRQGRRREEPKSERKVSSSSSPFDNLKDIFSDLRNRRTQSRKAKEGRDGEKGERRKADDVGVPKEEGEGFKYGDFEVFSSADGDVDDVKGDGRSSKKGAGEVDVIDVEIRPEGSDSDDAESESHHGHRNRPPKDEFSANGWTGGPKPASDDGVVGEGATLERNEDTIRRARELLARDPRVRAVVGRARLDPRLREAVRDCDGDPASFGRYLQEDGGDEDGGVGSLLRELRDCIS